MSRVVYKNIPGYRGYKADSSGNIWSCWQNRSSAGAVATDRWHCLTPVVDGRYLYVQIAGKKRGVHVLVLEAFCGPRPAGQVGRHLDGKPLNCRLDNLAYGTYAENEADKARHGRTARGSRSGTARLTEAKVLLMRKLRREGVSNADLALRFGVARPTVSLALSGATWAHVPMAEEGG